MTYAGRDSQKDIAARLSETEPKVAEVAARVAFVAKQVDELPPPDEDPGDLTVYLRNALR